VTAATAAPTRGRAAPAGRRGRNRRGRNRRLIGLLALLALVTVACVASIAVGTRSMGLGEVWRALLDSDLRSEEAVIVRQLRVPRTALGLMVGLALGIAGALMQGHTRNPLGDPGLLGITAGASLAVVLSIALLDITSPSGYVWFAFLGALAGTMLVYAIGAAGRGGATPVTLALAGAALSALLYGLVRAVVVSDQQTLDAFRFWVVGALAGGPTSPGRSARSSRSASCSLSRTHPRLTCSASARTSRVGWGSGSGWPASSGWPRSRCWRVPRPPPAGRSPSSGSSSRTPYARSPDPTTAG
jgi:hypothetical protein